MAIPTVDTEAGYFLALFLTTVTIVSVSGVIWLLRQAAWIRTEMHFLVTADFVSALQWYYARHALAALAKRVTLGR